MFGLVVYGVLFLAMTTFYLIRRRTLKKQRELNLQEFQEWFQKNYMGMSHFSEVAVADLQLGKKPEPVPQRVSSAQT